MLLVITCFILKEAINQGLIHYSSAMYKRDMQALSQEQYSQLSTSYCRAQKHVCDLEIAERIWI